MDMNKHGKGKGRKSASMPKQSGSGGNERQMERRMTQAQMNQKTGRSV